jgi:hypothetical protein
MTELSGKEPPSLKVEDSPNLHNEGVTQFKLRSGLTSVRSGILLLMALLKFFWG